MERLILRNWVQLSIFVGVEISTVISKIDIVSSSGKLISWCDFFIIDDPSVRAAEKSMLQEYYRCSSFEPWCSNPKIAQNIVIRGGNAITVNLKTIFCDHLLK
jgi:hypothetical protein